MACGRRGLSGGLSKFVNNDVGWLMILNFELSLLEGNEYGECRSGGYRVTVEKWMNCFEGRRIC